MLDRKKLMDCHFTKFWKQALHIVQPDTLLRWHRELFQFYWRRKLQSKPKITSETIALIEKIVKENHLWGAERIRGELLKLGIEVSKRSIQKYMPKGRQEPSTSHNWATFLKNQAEWTAQQLREATPWGKGPKYLIRDRDSKYSTQFSAVAVSSGIKELRTPYRTP